MYKVGDKVTIREFHRYAGIEPVGLTVVESVSTRIIKTRDGRRWNTKRGHEVDARGSEVGCQRIVAYKMGDEKSLVRAERLRGARALLRGNSWEVERDFDLLSDEDLDALDQIAKRLVLARERRAEVTKDKEVGS